MQGYTLPFTPTESRLIHTQAYLNGGWTNSSDAATFPVSDPAIGSLLAQVANRTASDAQEATKAA